MFQSPLTYQLLKHYFEGLDYQNEETENMTYTIDQIMDQDCAKAQKHNHSIEVIDQWIIESKELQEAIVELEFLIDGPISAEKQN